MVSMDWVVWLLPVFFSTFAAGLFTVEVDRSSYKSEFRKDVVMGCKFPTPSPHASLGIRVTWHWISSSAQVREVYRLDNGVEHLASQHPDYKDRARLLHEELLHGWAKLQVSDLKISDGGKYQCFVQTGAGADYKILTLSIFAPFRAITTKIEKAPKTEEVMLSCQSEGYPQPDVMWYINGQKFKNIPTTTTVVTTEDQLLEITTQINVTSLDKNNYVCNFTDCAATFEIPDDIPAPAEKNTTIIVVLSLVVTLALSILIFVLCKCHPKVLRSVRNRKLSEALGRALTLPAVKESQKETINEGEKSQMLPSYLKTLLKDHYLKWIKNVPWSHKDEQVPSHKLHNNEGQELSLDDLVPAQGDTLLLEGSTGSGKTTLARKLVLSWTELSVTPVSDFPDLSHLQLVVYVDGSKASGNLFCEIITQLSLEEVLSEDDLKNMLTEETLLIIDGYKEGNLLFDESLRRFLSDGRCRVLITAGLEQSEIKDIVGAGAIVRVQR